MHRQVTRIALVVLMSLVVVVSTGCVRTSVQEATPAPQPQLSEPDIITSGVLTVGVDYKHAPFSASSDQGVVGIDVDIAASIADSLGLKLQLLDVSDGSGAQKIADGQVDMVMSMSADGTADTEVQVIGRYIANGPSVFTVTTNGEPIVATSQDVMTATVGAQTDSVSSHALMDEFIGVDVTGFDSLDEAFTALENQEVKYVVSDAYAGAYLASHGENISFAGLIGSPRSVGIGVSSSNTVLAETIQTSLDSLATNGVLNLIRSAWVGNLPILASEHTIMQGVGISASSEETTATEDEDMAPAEEETQDSENDSASSLDGSQNALAQELDEKSDGAYWGNFRS